MANCGWPTAAEPGWCRRRHAPPISSHEASSSSRSRPGNTTAPCGSPAMVAISCGGRRHRSGRAGGDHRFVGVGSKPRGLGPDQRVAPGCRLDGATFGQYCGPRGARNLQELERELPVAVEVPRDQPVEPVPRDLAAWSCRPSGGRVRRRARARRRDCWRRAAPRPCRVGAMPAAHFITSCISSNRRSVPSRAGGNSSAAAATVAGRFLRECDLVLVDIAEGDDPRQDRRARSGSVEEEVARKPAGAARRQIEGGTRARERIARVGKAGYEHSLDQCADQRRYERHRGRDGEDVGSGHAESYTTLPGASADGRGRPMARKSAAMPRWR